MKRPDAAAGTWQAGSFIRKRGKKMETKNKRRIGSFKRFRLMFGNWFGLLLVIICGCLFYYLLNHISRIWSAAGYVIGLLIPVIYGMVIAYLLNPLMKTYYKWMIYAKKRITGKEEGKTYQKVCQFVSITLAMISGLLILFALGWLIVPQLVTTIGALANSLPAQVDQIYDQTLHYVQNNRFLQGEKVQQEILKVTESIDSWLKMSIYPWLKSVLLPGVNSVAQVFANGVLSVLTVFYNFFIGCIVAIYLLLGKDDFIAKAKKIIYAVMPQKKARIFLYYCRFTNDSFGGFITGKILDSFIIGVICFALMCIFHMEYALLISIIVGVTNVIPVFGPYIGAIPSALLLLLVSPLQCLYFVILIVVLQQFDGNILGPRILGESTGLSAFWVLFAILVFGGMWGVAGMLVGVPLFAVIYRLIKDMVELKLYYRNMPIQTGEYYHLRNIVQGDPPVYQRFTQEELFDSKLRREHQTENSLIELIEHQEHPETVQVQPQEEPEEENHD